MFCICNFGEFSGTKIKLFFCKTCLILFYNILNSTFIFCVLKRMMMKIKGLELKFLNKCALFTHNLNNLSNSDINSAGGYVGGKKKVGYSQDTAVNVNT